MITLRAQVKFQQLTSAKRVPSAALDARHMSILISPGCRKAARHSVTYVTSKTIRLLTTSARSMNSGNDLTGNADPSFCTAPMTFFHPPLSASESRQSQRSYSSSTLAFKRTKQAFSIIPCNLFAPALSPYPCRSKQKSAWPRLRPA